MLKIAEGFQIDKSDAKFGIFVDPRDNKEYPYKTFGTQTWMLKDLDYGTRVNVPTTQPGMTQAEGTCFKVKNVDNYGSWTEGRSALYIFPSLSWAVPAGWHVPTKDEWTTLQNWIKEQKGSSNGYPQKALLGKTHWYNLTYAATDEYGFGLLPQGYMYRSWTGTSVYWNYVETTAMTRGYWWTSTSVAENSYNVIYFYNSGSTFSNYTTYYKSGYNIEAFPVRLIKDAPAQTTEPEIESISITIPSSGASDSKLVTEKAVKDYVDSQAGGSSDHKVIIDSNDQNPSYLISKFHDSDTVSVPSITYPGNIQMLTPKVSGGTAGQFLQSTGSTEATWVDRPVIHQYNILRNQCSGAVTTTLDRTYVFQMWGTNGITKPEGIRTILYGNGGTDAEFAAYVWRTSDRAMTHYGTLTLSANTQGVYVPLTELDDFDPDGYWIGICIHAAGTGDPRFISGPFTSSCYYYDTPLASGDSLPANASLTASTTGTSIALVGR